MSFQVNHAATANHQRRSNTSELILSALIAAVLMTRPLHTMKDLFVMTIKSQNRALRRFIYRMKTQTFKRGRKTDLSP